MNVTIKSWEKLKEIATHIVNLNSRDECLSMPNLNEKYSNIFTYRMKGLCGKRISLRDWDGFSGSIVYKNVFYIITLPMINNFNSMNRNGANK